MSKYIDVGGFVPYNPKTNEFMDLSEKYILDATCGSRTIWFQKNHHSAHLVVFDPPHLLKIGENAWLRKKYGKLPEDWPKLIHDGFWECMRVLKPCGTLIFKWLEIDIPTREVIKAIGQEPLFGHRSGKAMKTHWLCYMKLESEVQGDDQ